MNTLVPLAQVAAVTQGLSTSGPGAGARPGEWAVQVVDSADIQDDRLDLDGLRTVSIQRNAKTEKHLLRPYDVLVTARSTTVKSALVPPAVARTVAGATLLVVRALEPELGMGLYLWYYLTSAYGRAQIEARLTAGATVASLSARSLEEVPVPLPSSRHLHRLACLIEESEEAYAAGLQALQLRRHAIRDHVITTLRRQARAQEA